MSRVALCGKRVLCTDIIVQTLLWLVSEGCHGETARPQLGESQRNAPFFCTWAGCLLWPRGVITFTPLGSGLDIAAAPVAGTGLQQPELEETAAPLLTLRGLPSARRRGRGALQRAINSKDCRSKDYK